MIKKIHYCWFGKKPLSKLAKKCINSWKKFFPDYEIIQWNENNFDISYNAYVKEAYSAKKWAFVSDVARFKILYDVGGIYFDTDVEVIKKFDKIIANGSFMGVERKSFINSGLGMYAEPGLNIFKEVLDLYNTLHYINPDGSYNTKTVVDYVTEIFVNHGYKDTGNIQTIANITIYPEEYFCPKDYETKKIVITENTYSIHHFDGSWLTFSSKIKMYIKRLVGQELYLKISRTLKRKK